MIVLALLALSEPARAESLSVSLEAAVTVERKSSGQASTQTWHNTTTSPRSPFVFQVALTERKLWEVEVRIDEQVEGGRRGDKVTLVTGITEVQLDRKGREIDRQPLYTDEVTARNGRVAVVERGDRRQKANSSAVQEDVFRMAIQIDLEDIDLEDIDLEDIEAAE